jgi:lipopolysaccharide export system protein LptA
MWRKRLRFGIALFVVVFAAVVVLELRKGRKPTAAPLEAPRKLDDKAVVNNLGAGEYVLRDPLKGGAIKLRITYGNQLTYADGSSKFGGGVKIEIPDKNGRQIFVEAQEARITVPPGKQVGTVDVTGSVKLTTSDGIIVTTGSASYNDDEKMTRIPGPLTFKKARMTGSGVGGTYDQTRNVLWLLDQAKVDVVADKKGNGAIHVTSKAAGMARADHYMKFTGDARMDGEGHVTEADEATAFLTQDDERITRMELRGNSRMTSKPGTSGPQDMRAKDIDLLYADDGRTLQSAKLVENAAVQLPGEKGKPGRRVAGKAMDIAMAADGATVKNLVANENVQADLPADGDTPARRIRSTSLMATGASGGGIDAATFSGNVELRENRAARGKLTEIDRTSKSDRMDIKTKPGFGDLERADFHSNVRFTDGQKTTAEAPTAVYNIAQDRLELSPGTGDTGRAPHVSDGRISVDAVRIQMGLSDQKMKADTQVRSVMTPQSGKPEAKPAPSRGGLPQGTGNAAASQPPAKTSDAAVKVPSMLKQDEPVNVKSNRLDYDGASSLATYEGNATLWQNETVIKADRIVLDDKTGNLHAVTNVISTMALTKPDDKKPAAGKPAAPKPVAETTTTVADDLLYDDAKHRATYTGHAHMNGPSGDVTGDTIELYLAEQGGQLERAEVDGNVVSRTDKRRAYGRHLSYLAKDDLYTMTGSPVKIYEQKPANCMITEGTTLVFDRSLSTSTATGNNTTGQRTRTEPACPAEGSF